MKGPRPKLPQIARLEGNPGKRPLLGDFIEPSGKPFVPEHLCDDAQGCMEVIMASMPDRVYSQADSYLLAAFAKAWAVHKEAAHRISAPDFEWILTNDLGVQKASPWIGILSQQAAVMAALGDRLGLNPKARVGISRPPADQPRSKFAGLIAQTKSSHSLNA